MSDNLAKAFAEMVTPNDMILEYRLYHDNKGRPITMSSHNHPDGKYIVITKEIYDRANYNCLVVNGKLTFELHTRFHVQLKPSSSGVAVVKGHASLVIEKSNYKDIEYYDRNN
jgi:hypothetical protein